MLLRVLTGLAAMTPLGKPAESIRSGHYGSPPNALWWLKQSIIYFGGLLGTKLCVLVVFLLFPWISRVGDWALGWTEGNERLQIAFVMMIFPLIMNALQYYIIDSFIKSAEPAHEPLPSEDPDAARPRRDLAAAAAAARPPARVPEGEPGGEYDPAVDGDAPTVVDSGSTRRAQRIGPVPADLFPKE